MTVKRIVCISDTHCAEIDVPDGDILLHAGDLTYMGKPDELRVVMDWLSSLPHKHKIFIAGNHDFSFQLSPLLMKQFIPENLIYLEDSVVEVEGIKIFGSPWVKQFYDWAFMYPADEDRWQRFDKIAAGSHIILTHGPRYGILDTNLADYDYRCGCELLGNFVDRVGAQMLVHGHLHDSHGVKKFQDFLVVNAAIGYYQEHEPIVVDVELEDNKLKIRNIQ